MTRAAAKIYDSPLGALLLAADGDGLTALDFLKAPPASMPAETNAALQTASRWLDVYFSGRDPGFTPPLHLCGTPFRLAVWRLLLDIPYGETTTYGALAKTISARRSGAPMSAQAVGGAVGHNPVALIVPCHRVVGTNGSLTGYASGLDKKTKLLSLEGIRIANGKILASCGEQS